VTAPQPAWDALPPTTARRQPVPQAASPESREEKPAERPDDRGESSRASGDRPSEQPSPPSEPVQEPTARRSSETIQFEPPPGVPGTSAKTTREERRDDWFQLRPPPERPAAQPPSPRPTGPRHARPQQQQPTPDQPQAYQQPPRPDQSQPQAYQQPPRADQGQPQAYQQPPRPDQSQPQAYQQPPRADQSQPQAYQQAPDQGQHRDQPRRIAPPQPGTFYAERPDPQVTRPNPQPGPGRPEVRGDTPQGSGSYPVRTDGRRSAQGGAAPYQPTAYQPTAYQPTTWQQTDSEQNAWQQNDWQQNDRQQNDRQQNDRQQGDRRSGAAVRPEGEWQPAAHMQAGAWEGSYREQPGAWGDGGQQAVALREHQDWEPQRAEEPRRAERRRRRSKGKVLAIVGGALVALLAVAAGVQLVRPVPTPKVKLTLASTHTFGGQSPTLPWPSNAGQAAIDVAGIGMMGTMGAETPISTASVAKVMTAYIFLRDHPLAQGQDGPTFTIGAAEAARLRWRQQRQESLVIVKAGQPFTERQALEALLVVSASNVAHEMARWDAGGDAQFVARMNATARQLGMTHTTYTDPSGFDATTVSTATDQVKLLRAAMTIPAFVETAGQQVLNIANNPVRYATNALLGVDGVEAGKTGWTTAAGGNFVFAARKQVGDAQVLLVGAVMGQKGVGSSETTVESTKPLIEAAEQALTTATIVGKGAVVGEVSDGLGGSTPLVAGKDVSAIGWPGLTVRLNLAGAASVPHQAPQGSRLGAISLGGGQGAPEVPITLARALDSPGYLARLTRLT
jgi:D-alanyl-D-alanine carboxypeptidase